LSDIIIFISESDVKKSRKGCDNCGHGNKNEGRKRRTKSQSSGRNDSCSQHKSTKLSRKVGFALFRFENDGSK